MSNSVTISVLPGADTLVIRKLPSSRVFITTDDSIIIGRGTLLILLNYMIKEGFISHKVIEGLLEEFNTL